MTDLGITRTHLWFADNWDTQLQVRMMGVQSLALPCSNYVARFGQLTHAQLGSCLTQPKTAVPNMVFLVRGR